MTTKQQVRLTAYKTFLINVIGACAALYELVTGEKAPKLKDILKG